MHVKHTRYFSFIKVKTQRNDFKKMFNTCDRIKACCGFKTIHEDGSKKLIGFIILNGPRTHTDDLNQLFPNLKLSIMKDGEDLKSFNIRGKISLDDIKRNLFNDKNHST